MAEYRDDRTGTAETMASMPRRLMPGVPAAAGWLGLSGLLPFFGLSLMLIFEVGPGDRIAGLLAEYGAVILSFMGGCRWGFAAAGHGASPGGATALWRYGISVLPALWAWPVLAMPDPWRMGLLALGFLGLLAADVRLAEAEGAPTWWPAMRWPLTLGAAASLLFAALAG
ncbi:MAG: DUF3429 domain-containing protein [Pseudomonadota bacterium]